MSGWQRVASGYLFVTTEAIAWFIVLRAFGSAIERGRLEPLASDIERSLRIGTFQDEIQAGLALDVLRDAIDAASGGPPIIVVVGGAVGAYAFARWLGGLRVPNALRLGLGFLVSVLALQVLLHVAITGDPFVWDNTGLGSFIDNPASSLDPELDAASFVADPDLDRVTGASLMIVAVGTFALWLRFLVAGRVEPYFEQVLRSFTFGFMAVLVGVIVGRVAGSELIPALALPYFVLAMLTLAIAHAARAATDGPAEETVRRGAPWAVSVFVTLGLIAAVALLFAGLSALGVQRVFAPAGAMVLAAFEYLFILILRPVFFVVNGFLRFVIGEPDLDVFDRAAQIIQGQEPDNEAGLRESRVPGWLLDAGRIALVSGVGYLLYRLGRSVFRRGRRHSAEQYEELRERGGSGGSGLGGLVQRLMPRRKRPARDADWLHRHAVYRLFARVVNDAHDRGLPRIPGETPVEFAREAGRRLDAPLFPPIAEVFDRARYGRHYPADQELAPLESALGRWELSHPVGASAEALADEAAAASAASSDADERRRDVPRDFPPQF